MGAPTFNHVAAHSKHKDAAFKFIAWMGDVEAAKAIAEGGILPATINEEVKTVLAKSIPDSKSLDYFTEAKISFPIGMNKYGSAIEGYTERTIIENYLLGKIPDNEFNEVMRKGLQEIIDTTD
jgi:ABC-type Fe3+ transport system substrate-binding protein